jgi:hypothetical protein
MNTFSLDDREKPAEWLITPDEPASFGLGMWDGPECTGDIAQEVEITRAEFKALKSYLAQLRAVAATPSDRAAYTPPDQSPLLPDPSARQTANSRRSN